jgi:hypothetical protein
MRCRLFVPLIAAFVAGPAATNFASSSCGTEVVVLKGRVEPPSRNASVRVHLLYAKKQKQERLGKQQQEQFGESGEVTVDNGRFTIQIPFLTDYREPVIFAEFRNKCDRKPKTVVVTLFEGDEERDRISLDMAKDFTKADATAYTPRSDIVLRVPINSLRWLC